MRVLLAMAVLLFLSPRHGRAAYQIQGSSGETLTRKRSAPETTWVKSLAQRHGLLHLLGDQRMDKHSSGQMAASGKVPRAGLTSLRALAAITPGQLGRGVLTEWGAQEEYLRNFLYEGERFLHSVFSLQVVRIVAFSRPFDSNSPIRFTSDLWEPDKLEYADFLQRSGLDRQGLRRGLGVCSEDIAAFCSSL